MSGRPSQHGGERRKEHATVSALHGAHARTHEHCDIRITNRAAVSIENKGCMCCVEPVKWGGEVSVWIALHKPGDDGGSSGITLVTSTHACARWVCAQAHAHAPTRLRTHHRGRVAAPTHSQART